MNCKLVFQGHCNKSCRIDWARYACLDLLSAWALPLAKSSLVASNSHLLFSNIYYMYYIAIVPLPTDGFVIWSGWYTWRMKGRYSKIHDLTMALVPITSGSLRILVIYIPFLNIVSFVDRGNVIRCRYSSMLHSKH